MAAALGMGLSAMETGCSTGKVSPRFLEGVRNKWRIGHPLVKEPVRLVIAGDAHLTIDDERGEQWRRYSRRMASAYRVMRHWRTGAEVKTPAGFLEAVRTAQEKRPDLFALVGDIVSFPSEAGVDFVVKTLKEAHVPWSYVAGNHDWHYEGEPGTLNDLRAKWCGESLGPLYQGENPLMHVRMVKGVRMVFIDDSTWEILPCQLEFLREQLESGDPVALYMHIPLFACGCQPGLCPVGDPSWGWQADRNYEKEGRSRWPKGGHTEITYAFRDAVFSSSNVIAVFAGHLHVPMSVEEDGTPQIVTECAASGGHLEVEIVPSSRGMEY